ncbi:unnamed protein product [Cuscuta campestris]|uniref:No apical meristem-associated C-terminal domain-containing protein n=1 Tax=Cuscuta campestris TaxID=132261 RepID=A0A484KTG8_9ASTE|nr:unnamed protein product [Cuscuta campestris]
MLPVLEEQHERRRCSLACHDPVSRQRAPRSTVVAEVEVDETIGSTDQIPSFNVAGSDDEDPIPRPIGRKKAKSIASGSGGSASVSASPRDEIGRAMVEQLRAFNLQEQERLKLKEKELKLKEQEAEMKVMQTDPGISILSFSADSLFLGISMAYAINKDTPVLQLHAKTHFPIKLITTNFPIWQRQVRSTLIGLNLLGYIDGTLTSPPTTVDGSANPCYSIWFRQDQSIVGALLGSCTDTIQPLISNVETAREAWLNLHSSFASASRGHILALKSKLGKNPRGARSINEYLHEMHSLANELALNQSPVAEEDLVSHVLNQLGLEYDPVASAAFIRGSKLPFSELGDVLRDFEHKLTLTDDATSTVVATTNATQRHPSTGTHWQCFWFVGIVLSVLW